MKSEDPNTLDYFNGNDLFTNDLIQKIYLDTDYLYLLEEPSKIGKTTQALKIYYDRCKAGKPTIFLSLKENEG